MKRGGEGPFPRAKWCALLCFLALFCSGGVLAADLPGGKSSAEVEDEDLPQALSAKKVFSPPLQGGEPELQWSIPPTPWKANLSLSGVKNFSSGGNSGVAFMQALTTSASSYVWHPWFMKVSGNLAYSHSQSGGGNASTETNSYSMGGGGGILHGTRYPFSFNGSRTQSGGESRSGGVSSTIAETTSSTVGLGQIYTPYGGGYSVTANYNRMSVTSSPQEAGVSPWSLTAQNLGANMAIPLRTQNPQSLNMSTNLMATDTLSGARARNSQLSAAHAIYLEDYVMDISTGLLLNSNTRTVSQDREKNSVTSLSSAMSWIPSDDYPLTIAASANYLDNQAGAGQGASQASIFGFGGSAAYPIDRWRLQGDLRYTKSSSSFVGASFSRAAYLLSGTANWTSEGLTSKWKEWDYQFGYGAGGGLSVAGGSTGDTSANATVSGNLSQGLRRMIPREGGDPVQANISQSMSANASTGSSNTAAMLSHSASFTWQGTPSNLARTNYSLTASDARQMGQGGYQSVNGNVLLSAQTGAYATFSANAALIYSRQTNSVAGQAFYSLYGGASYGNQRFAGVSGLVYSASYSLSLRPKPGQNDSGFFVDHVANQSWAWRFGLLGWSATHSLSKFAKNAVNQSVMVYVSRDFGGVL